jgi:hypothetical protein
MTVIRSKADVDAQTQAIRDLLNDHYDGIAISPIPIIAIIASIAMACLVLFLAFTIPTTSAAPQLTLSNDRLELSIDFSLAWRELFHRHFVSDMTSWLAARKVDVEHVNFCITDPRGVEEVVLHLDGDGGRVVGAGVGEPARLAVVVRPAGRAIERIGHVGNLRGRQKAC